MPRYVFECQLETCNLRFERSLKMGEHLSHACPNCGEVAPRVFDKVDLSFGFAPSDGATANSGVHKDDYPTADRLVGKDADARWARLHEREKVKKVARDAGHTHALIRQDGPGYVEYDAMTPQGLQTRKIITQKAVQAVQRAKEARQASRPRQ